jgi:hypothetical protein
MLLASFVSASALICFAVALSLSARWIGPFQPVHLLTQPTGRTFFKIVNQAIDQLA